MVACEQALLFGRVKRVSRERASERRSHERRSREALFACPNRKACSQASIVDESKCPVVLFVMPLELFLVFLSFFFGWLATHFFSLL